MSLQDLSGDIRRSFAMVGTLKFGGILRGYNGEVTGGLAHGG